jgi:lipopolysaccharide/colanic/teichoic acid biosynthesis glycosyltransferase
MEQLNNFSTSSVWQNPITVTTQEKSNYEPDFNNEVKNYILEYVDLYSVKTKILSSSNPAYVDQITASFSSFVNLEQFNNIIQLNELLREINKKLSTEEKFVCCAETLEQRKARLFNKYPKLIYYPFSLADFLLKRVFPKLGLTRRIIARLSNGKDKAMSFTQILGRLVYTGFRVIDFQEINGLTYFICDKEKEPSPNAPPSLGLVFKMRRVGKDGKIINVYKIRTMHPYSEYLQKYVYELNGSVNGDKITNDFRLAGWGKLLRKLWLDELPMIINLLKGDIKLVGVRPLSLYKFETYPKDVQKLRTSAKPGLIPPFYADLPKNFDELVESERQYLLKYKKNPLLTDFKYFCKCFYNIVIKQARSS